MWRRWEWRRGGEQEAGGCEVRSGDSGSGGSDSGNGSISESDSEVAVTVLISAVYRLDTMKSVQIS